MKTFLICLLIAIVFRGIQAQTLETVQTQIIDLEEAKMNIQIQLKDIDKQLAELYTVKHNLTTERLGGAHPAVTISTTNLYNQAKAGGERKTLLQIPKNTRLVIEKKEWATYKTSYGGMNGYVSFVSVRLENPDSKDILEAQYLEEKKTLDSIRSEQYRIEEERKRAEREAKLEKDQQEQKARWEKLAVEWKAKMRAKYSPADANRIIEKKIWIGMTKEMMIDSWGQPKDINRSVGSWGVHEQCIYDGANVYIENGKVTSWQD